MAEEEGEDAKQDVTMSWGCVSGPDVRDGGDTTGSLQHAVGDHAKHQQQPQQTGATLAGGTPSVPGQTNFDDNDRYCSMKSVASLSEARVQRRICGRS